MASPEFKVVSNATCTFCGCVCDGRELTVYRAADVPIALRPAFESP
jgi:hypothetical protein